MTSFRYALDATGRRRSLQENNGRNVVWNYDNLYRLTRETVTDPTSGDYEHEYRYDAVGNRRSRVVNGVVFESEYDDNDSLTSFEGALRRSDEDGNQLDSNFGGGAIYRWDPESRLVGIDFDDSSKMDVSHGYDIDGRRLRKAVGAEETFFVYDVAARIPNLIEESAAIPGPTAYFWAKETLLGEIRGVKATYYFEDGSGTVRTKAVSPLEQLQFNFSALGEANPSTSTSTSGHMFHSKYLDAEADTYYVRARYYDPHSGRFLGRDPLNLPAALTSAFAYAQNDPIALSDPSGEFTLVELLLVVAIVGVSATLVHSIAEVIVPREKGTHTVRINDMTEGGPADVVAAVASGISLAQSRLASDFGITSGWGARPASEALSTNLGVLDTEIMVADEVLDCPLFMALMAQAEAVGLWRKDVVGFTVPGFKQSCVDAEETVELAMKKGLVPSELVATIMVHEWGHIWLGGRHASESSGNIMEPFPSPGGTWSTDQRNTITKALRARTP